MGNMRDNQNVHAGHRMRVKANVRENGFAQLEDHRLLELILFYAIPRADTNATAHALLQEFGSLKDVFSADVDALCRVPGVGENCAILLSSIGETNIRLQKPCDDRRNVYKTHKAYCTLAEKYLAGERKEKVLAFCFDAAGRLKKNILISEGTQNWAIIEVRKIVQGAMECDAMYVVLAHNHPYGEGEASVSDLDSTRATSVTLRKLGIKLADHIIVDENNIGHSMYEEEKIMNVFY